MPPAPVQPLLVELGVELRYRRVVIRTTVQWEKLYDFHSNVLDPLMSAGAEIEIRLQLSAQAERELGSGLIERLRESLKKYDEEAELDSGGS